MLSLKFFIFILKMSKGIEDKVEVAVGAGVEAGAQGEEEEVVVPKM